MAYNPIHTTYTTTIPNGTALSAAIHLGGDRAIAIQMPVSWTAASITLQASTDGATWYELYDSYGNEITLTVAAGNWIVLDPTVFAGINHLILRSGTAGTPVNQAADRAITVVTRPL